MLRLTISMLRRLLPYGPRFRVSFEWPRNSDRWNPQKCPEIRQLTRLLRHSCSIDGCAYGLRDRQGDPVKKPWRIQTNDSATMSKINLRCPGHPVHSRVGSGKTQTGRYTPKLVSALCRALDFDGRLHRREPEPREAFPAAAERPRRVPPRPEVDAHILRQAIKTMHTNLGHPENRALARAIRLTGGTEEAIKVAMEHQCTMCARLRTPMPVPPARISENAIPQLQRLHLAGHVRPGRLPRSDAHPLVHH